MGNVVHVRVSGDEGQQRRHRYDPDDGHGARRRGAGGAAVSAAPSLPLRCLFSRLLRHDAVDGLPFPSSGGVASSPHPPSEVGRGHRLHGGFMAAAWRARPRAVDARGRRRGVRRRGTADCADLQMAVEAACEVYAHASLPPPVAARNVDGPPGWFLRHPMPPLPLTQLPAPVTARRGRIVADLCPPMMRDGDLDASAFVEDEPDPLPQHHRRGLHAAAAGAEILGLSRQLSAVRGLEGEVRD